MANIFEKKTQAYDPIRELRGSASIEILLWDFGDGEGKVEEPVVSFSLNPGRGTGKQTIPVSELPRYIDVLKTALAGDVDETIPVVEVQQAEDGYTPTYEILAKNLCRAPSGTMLEEYENREGKTAERTVVDPDSTVEVMLRSKVGRGAKASHLPIERLPELLEVLDMIDSQQVNFIAKAREAYALKLEKAEAKRQKAISEGRNPDDESDDGDDD